MQLKTNFWIEDEKGKILLDAQTRNGLELIQKTGSIKEAASSLNISTSFLSTKIKKAEQAFSKKLIIKSSGKNSVKLSTVAKKIIRDFDLIERKGTEKAEEVFSRKFLNDKSLEQLPAILAVVGPKGAGKSELVLEIVREWANRGGRAGVIRRLPQKALRTNNQKEAVQLLSANGLGIAYSSKNGLNLEIPLEDELYPEITAATYFPGADLVLVESTERLHMPTIEIYKKTLGSSLITRKAKDLLLVTGDRLLSDKKRTYRKADDIAGLVDLIEARISSDRKKDLGMSLSVNGRRVPMLPFVQDIFKKTITALISTLKSCEQAGDIKLTIRRD